MKYENFVYLVGQVRFEPYVAYNCEGDPIRASLVLTALTEVPELEFTYPYIESHDPIVIDQIRHIKLYDFIFVKGVIATANIKRTTMCPQCGRTNLIAGSLDYIEASFVGIWDHATSLTDTYEHLKGYIGTGNSVVLMGTVCTNPESFVGKNSTRFTRYKVEVYHEHYSHDPSLCYEDTPRVKSFAPQSEKDQETLHIGSRVYISGCIIAEKKRQIVCCSSCRKEYPLDYMTMAIIPSTIECFAEPQPPTEEQKSNVKSLFFGLFHRRKGD